MKDTNMCIWDQVKTTDPAHTKKVTQRGGYTAVSPQYQLQEATKVFGPYGKGFGFESCSFDYSQLEPLGLVLVNAVFFYTEGESKYTFPVNNAWPVKQGTRIDADFAKKAETNTMSKALSKLGFSADIFMGLFDDDEYVAMIASESAIEKAEDKIAEEENQKAQYRDKCANEIRLLSGAVSLNDLQKNFAEYVRRANLRQDKDHILALTKVKDDMKGKLK